MSNQTVQVNSKLHLHNPLTHGDQCTAFGICRYAAEVAGGVGGEGLPTDAAVGGADNFAIAAGAQQVSEFGFPDRIAPLLCCVPCYLLAGLSSVGGGHGGAVAAGGEQGVCCRIDNHAAQITCDWQFHLFPVLSLIARG